MENKYPLYPPLSDEAQKEAVALIEDFKKKIEDVANETISTLYTDILPYIESDAWDNYRSQLMQGFMDWNNSKIQGKYDFKQIRHAIFKQFREEIMKEMPEELVAENESLRLRLELAERGWRV